MKAIKQFICLLVCFVLLSSSFMIGYAVDDGDYEPVFPLPEDLIDMGFVEDEDGIFTYIGNDDPFDFGISWFSSSEKNFPDFNPVTDIPWSTFPQYIKDIVFMGDDGLTAVGDDVFRLPFVNAVVVSDQTVQILVGTNVGWGWLNDANISLGVWSLPIFPSASSYSCLYRLSWNYVNQSIVADWTEYKPQSYGNKGNLNRMLNYYFNDASVLDIYGYGGNGVRSALLKYTSGEIQPINNIVVDYNSSNSSLLCSFSLSPDGFKSGNFVASQDVAFPYIYFQYFSPPSEETIQQQLQQEQNETSKSIWETLKSVLEYIKHLPSNIANLIKEFFTTLGDRISGFFTNLGDRISDFFTTLKNYILYFQAEEPDLNEGWGYSDFLTDLRDYVYEMKKNLTDFNNSLDTTFESIESYITTGSEVINRLLSGVPILNTVLIFFLIFAVVRKAVGR